MCNVLFPIAVEKVDERNLNHCVATWLLAHCGACTADKNLRCERGVIDAHIKLEQLVLRCTRNTLTGEVHAVTHIKQVINARHLLYVGLVIDKIWVGLYGCSNLFKVAALLNLNINHTAVYACTHRDCH